MTAGAIVSAVFGLLFVALLAHFQCRDLKWRAERARAAHHRLHLWIRGNLLIIRCECSASPEALSIVNSLERALAILGQVDGADLRDDLARIQQAHDAELLRMDAQLRAKSGSANATLAK